MIGSLVPSATVIFEVPSKLTPLIVLAVVSFGAETIVIAGVEVGFATVSSPVAEDTFVTVPLPPPQVAFKIGAFGLVTSIVRLVQGVSQT